MLLNISPFVVTVQDMEKAKQEHKQHLSDLKQQHTLELAEMAHKQSLHKQTLRTKAQLGESEWEGGGGANTETGRDGTQTVPTQTDTQDEGTARWVWVGRGGGQTLKLAEMAHKQSLHKQTLRTKAQLGESEWEGGGGKHWNWQRWHTNSHYTNRYSELRHN